MKTCALRYSQFSRSHAARSNINHSPGQPSPSQGCSNEAGRGRGLLVSARPRLMRAPDAQSSSVQWRPSGSKHLPRGTGGGQDATHASFGRQSHRARRRDPCSGGRHERTERAEGGSADR